MFVLISCPHVMCEPKTVEYLCDKTGWISGKTLYENLTKIGKKYNNFDIKLLPADIYRKDLDLNRYVSRNSKKSDYRRRLRETVENYRNKGWRCFVFDMHSYPPEYFTTNYGHVLKETGELDMYFLDDTKWYYPNDPKKTSFLMESLSTHLNINNIKSKVFEGETRLTNRIIHNDIMDEMMEIGVEVVLCEMKNTISSELRNKIMEIMTNWIHGFFIEPTNEMSPVTGIVKDIKTDVIEIEMRYDDDGRIYYPFKNNELVKVMEEKDFLYIKSDKIAIKFVGDVSKIKISNKQQISSGNLFNPIEKDFSGKGELVVNSSIEIGRVEKTSLLKKDKIICYYTSLNPVSPCIKIGMKLYGGKSSLVFPQPKSGNWLRIKEDIYSENFLLGNIDSLAVYKDILLCTAKKTGQILFFDKKTLKLKNWTKFGSMRKPNGISVCGNYCFVTEIMPKENNGRICVISLLNMNIVSRFGEKELIAPYGIDTISSELGGCVIYVADNVRKKNSNNKSCIRCYSTKDFLNFDYTGSFGEIDSMIESIVVDEKYQRVIVAAEKPINKLLVYSISREYISTIKHEYFGEPEGMCLFGNYFISTDQNRTNETNIFNVYNRETMLFEKYFSLENTSNTDGIATDGKSIFFVDNDRKITCVNKF